MPSHGEYLKDGLYRCENDDCPELRVAPDGTKQQLMFTGGSNHQDPDTNEWVYHEGVCPACAKPAVKINPETLEAE